MLLKKTAKDMNLWDRPDGAPGEGQLLFENIRRLTTVAVPAAGGGWENVPLHVAVNRKFLSADDQHEVENAIVFFIVNSAMLPRQSRAETLEAAVGLWGARLSSSNSSDFTASLKKSKGTASSGETSPVPAPEERAGASATKDGKRSSVPV
jgi:hypothetical protein